MEKLTLVRETKCIVCGKWIDDTRERNPRYWRGNGRQRNYCSSTCRSRACRSRQALAQWAKDAKADADSRS